MADNPETTEEETPKKILGVKVPKVRFGKASMPLAVVLGGAAIIGGYTLISNSDEGPDLATVKQTRTLDNTPGGAVEQRTPSLRAALETEERNQFQASQKTGDSFVPSQLGESVAPKPFEETEPAPTADAPKKVGVEAFLEESAAANADARPQTDTTNDGAVPLNSALRNQQRGQAQPTESPIEAARRDEMERLIASFGAREYQLKPSRFSHGKGYREDDREATVDGDQDQTGDRNITRRYAQAASATVRRQVTPASSGAAIDHLPGGGDQSGTQEQVELHQATPNGGNGADNVLEGVRGGDVVYATMFNTASTDAPSTIIAKTHTGKLKGAMVFGSFTQGRKSLVLNFTRAHLSDGRSCNIRALAVDLATARTDIASRYESRWLQRNLPLAAGAFLDTFLAGIATPETTTVTSDFGTITQITREQTTEEALAAGGAAVGRELANDARQAASNTPPLIEVEAGTEFGLIFEDVPTCR